MLDDVKFDNRRGRSRRDHGSVRLRQVHDDDAPDHVQPTCYPYRKYCDSAADRTSEVLSILGSTRNRGALRVQEALPAVGPRQEGSRRPVGRVGSGGGSASATSPGPPADTTATAAGPAPRPSHAPAEPGDSSTRPRSPGLLRRQPKLVTGSSASPRRFVRRGQRRGNDVIVE
jgi:hypothetical protein